MALEAIEMHDVDVVSVIDFLALVINKEDVTSLPLRQDRVLRFGDHNYSYKSLYWIPSSDLRKTVRKVFGALYDYVDSMGQVWSDTEDLSKHIVAKDILNIVEEAAKKIDSIAHVVGWKKGRDLSKSVEYYEITNVLRKRLRRMAHFSHLEKADAISFHSKSKIPSLAQVDLQWDTVDKKAIDISKVVADLDYELMLIKSVEDRLLVSPNLVRKGLKSASKGLSDSKRLNKKELAILNQVTNLSLQQYASRIKNQIWFMVDEYFIEVRRQNKGGPYELLSKSLLALMLAASSASSSLNNKKRSIDYYKDYVCFYKKALQSNIVKGWLACPPQKNRLDRLAYRLLGFSLWVKMRIPFYNSSHLQPFLDVLGLTPDLSPDQLGWDQIIGVLEQSEKSFGSSIHPDLLPDREQLKIGFNPNINGYLPSLTAGIKCLKTNKSIPIVSICAPVIQKRIDQAAITDEMKMLFSYFQDRRSHRKIIVLDLEDAMSWNGLARSKATYAKLSKIEEKNLYWINLPLKGLLEKVVKDKAVEAVEFANLFMEKLNEYHELYPSSYKLEAYINNIVTEKSIAKLLFHLSLAKLNKNEQAFAINFLVQWISLLSIAHLDPDFIWVVSKGGIDYGPTFISELGLLLNFSASIDQKSLRQLFSKLLGPSLINRRRGLVKEDLEYVKNWISSLHQIYSKNTIDSSSLEEVMKVSLDDLKLFYPE